MSKDTYYIIEFMNESGSFKIHHKHKRSAVKEAKRISTNDDGTMFFVLNSQGNGHIAFYNGKVDHVDGEAP